MPGTRSVMKFTAVLFALSVVVPTAFAASSSRDATYRPNSRDVALARKSILGRAFIGKSPHLKSNWIAGVPTCSGFAPDQSALTVTGRAAGFYTSGYVAIGSEMDVYDSLADEQAAWHMLAVPAYALCAAQKLVVWWHAKTKLPAKLVGVYRFQPRGGPREEVGYQIAVRLTPADVEYHSIVWMSLDNSIARVESASPSPCTCADEAVGVIYRNYYT